MEKLKERNTFKYNGNYCHVDLIEYDTHNDVNYAIEFHRNQTNIVWRLGIIFKFGCQVIYSYDILWHLLR